MFGSQTTQNIQSKGTEMIARKLKLWFDIAK